MVKKFKDWRDQLTWQQVKRIRWIVGIIVTICFLICFFPPNARYYDETSKTNGATWASYTGDAILILWGIAHIAYKLLHGPTKQSNFENDKLKEKFDSRLKEDEFTEVYLKKACRRGVSVIILDGYDAHEIKYFAKKQGDDAYVVSKENDEQLEDYTIEDWKFFEDHFTFTKKKE